MSTLTPPPQTEAKNETQQTTVTVTITYVRKEYLTTELVQYYTTVQCPFCGEQHSHGSNTGTFGDDRLANCGRGKYILQMTQQTTHSETRPGECVIS